MNKDTAFRTRAWVVGSLGILIVLAHVFLWRSGMPTGQKIFWTALNALGWTVILAPALLVDRWLDAVRARNHDHPAREP